MSQVQCRHCGHYIAPDLESCPYCAAEAPAGIDGEREGSLRRFRLFYVLLFIFCLWMILYLPRAIFE